MRESGSWLALPQKPLIDKHTFATAHDKALIRATKGAADDVLRLNVIGVFLHDFSCINVHKHDLAVVHADEHMLAILAHGHRRHLNIVEYPISDLFLGREVIDKNPALQQHSET